MNTELTNRLYHDFPQLYLGHTKPTEESAMGWGFQCDDGWYALIRSLSQQLTDYAMNHPDVNIEAIVVKQKFGRLTFAISEGDDATQEMIERAIHRASTTCELTGQPGVLCVKSVKRWLKVLSEEKAAELGFVPLKNPSDNTNICAEGTNASS